MSLLASPAARIDPYPLYHQLREQGSVQWDETLGCWIVLGYAAMLSALRDTRLSVERPDAGEGAGMRTYLDRYVRQFMMFRDPPEHAALRAPASRSFSAAVVETLRPRVEAATADLLASAAKRRKTNLVRDLANPLPIRILGDMLGAPEEDVPLFERWSGDFAPLADASCTPVQERALLRSLEEMARYFRECLDVGRGRRPDDLLGTLAASGGEEVLLANVLLLIVAGHITSTNLIANAIFALLRHPAELARLRNEPALLESAVEELLRYDTPVQWAGRWAHEPLELGGQQIEAGEVVSLCFGAANRDPARFPDPDRLDLDREDNRHVAFGFGTHFCLGAALARLQAQVAISQVIQLPDLRLNGEVEWHSTHVLRGVRSLPVAFDRAPVAALTGGRR